jgi:Fe(3+) dicitrate transport protein
MSKILFLTFLFLSSGIRAQQEIDNDSTLSLPEVCIVGKQVKSLPGSGHYISPEKLAKLNQPDINKTLRTVPGVNIRDEEGFGLRPNIGLRGVSVNRSAKITIMEDGILIAPAPYADPSAYYFPTLARMEAIEVLKGSSQIQYGPYTIGGALNLLSTSIPESFKGFALLSYGSFGTNQQRIWIGDSKKKLDYIFEFNRWASLGFKQLDNDGGNTGFDRRDFMGKLRWHTDKSAKIQQFITLKYVNSTEEANESYLGLTYQDFKANPNRRYAATQKDFLDMKHRHISLNYNITPLKSFNINVTGYYAQTFRDWARVNTIGGVSLNNILANPLANDTAYRIMTGRMNGNLDYQSAARNYTARGAQANLSYQFLTGELKHNLQIGLRYHQDEADRFATRSTYAMINGIMVQTSAGITGNQENQIRKGTSFSSYLQYNLHYKNLSITPGVRYEDITLDFKNYGNADFARLGDNLKTAQNQLSILLPGIGFNYAINSFMTLFGGFHKGFSPPGMPSLTSVEQAKVETAFNYELGYRYQNRNINAQACFFWSEYANILGSDNISGGGLGTGNMFNAGNARVLGLEFNLEYDLMKTISISKDSPIRLPLGIVYTYTHARFKRTFKGAGGDWGTGIINKNDLIPFITPHLLTTILSIENDKFNLNLISRFVGETRTKPSQGEVILPKDEVKYSEVNTIASSWVFDLSGNYKFHKNTTVFTLINNLFNSAYIVANLPQGYRPGIPLAFNLGLKFDF